MATQMMTPKEFAAAFGVSQRTVYNWIAQARLDYFRIGGTIRIPVDEVSKSLRKKAESCETCEV